MTNPWFAKLINLSLSGAEIRASLRYTGSDPSDKLSEIVEIMLIYGESLNDSTKQSLGDLVELALDPTGQFSAKTMLDLLRFRRTSDLIARYSIENPMEILRTNILDKDAWRFPLLSQIDEILETDPEASMAVWGNDYLYYVDRFVEDLADSHDYEELDEAIRELRDIGSFLDVDLDDSIETLREQRDNLPPEREEEEYERYGSDGSRSNDASSSRELDNIFASLLE